MSKPGRWSLSNIGLAPTLHNCSIALLVCGIISCGSDGGTGLDVPEVATVTVTPASSTIAPGGTVQLQAAIQDEGGSTLSDREITWSSSDNAVATASSNGLVTGVAGGSATITGTSEGKSGTATVVVETPVASVVVSPDAATITLSETVSLAAATLDAAGNELTDREVSWSSSNPDVASVSGTGLVTPLADGTVTITATVEGQSGSAVITVVGATADIAGQWSLHETLSDDNLGYACENFQNVTLVQDGMSFNGTNEQVGSCTIGDETFDNSGTFEITDGQIRGSAISFSQPGAIPCMYEGTVLDPVMDGTVSCTGSVEGIRVNATGTWCAERVGGARLQPARGDEPDYEAGRVPTCT
jgi:hypothetical protein